MRWWQSFRFNPTISCSCQSVRTFQQVRLSISCLGTQLRALLTKYVWPLITDLIERNAFKNRINQVFDNLFFSCLWHFLVSFASALAFCVHGKKWRGATQEARSWLPATGRNKATSYSALGFEYPICGGCLLFYLLWYFSLHLHRWCLPKYGKLSLKLIIRDLLACPCYLYTSSFNVSIQPHDWFLSLAFLRACFYKKEGAYPNFGGSVSIFVDTLSLLGRRLPYNGRQSTAFHLAYITSRRNYDTASLGK